MLDSAGNAAGGGASGKAVVMDRNAERASRIARTVDGTTQVGNGGLAAGFDARQFAARVACIPGSAIDRSIALLAKQTHPVVPFAFGAPAPEAIPTELLAGFAAQAYRDQGSTALAYGPTEGEPMLRAALLDDLRANGVAIADSELIVTAGGTQGLDLAMKLFVGPGDLVIAESPTYPNGVAIATGYDGRVLRCPIDEDGLVVEAMPDLVARTGQAPKLIYAIPTFQNPGGCTLSLTRRHALLDLAERYDCIVIEDDPYGGLWFETPPPASLWTLERERPGRTRRVIAVHTFSKILAPGLRVGWVQAPAPVIARMIDAKQGLDTCPNVPAQRMIAGFMQAGLLPDQVTRLRGLYGVRRDAMETALRKHFGNLGELRWTSPGGGFFLWVTLPASIDADELFPHALEAGVAFIPGSAFLGPEAPRHSLRLSFAWADPATIDRGIARLRRAIDGMWG